jgi:hypothetical protein
MAIDQEIKCKTRVYVAREGHTSAALEAKDEVTLLVLANWWA